MTIIEVSLGQFLWQHVSLYLCDLHGVINCQDAEMNNRSEDLDELREKTHASEFNPRLAYPYTLSHHYELERCR